MKYSYRFIDEIKFNFLTIKFFGDFIQILSCSHKNLFTDIFSRSRSRYQREPYMDLGDSVLTRLKTKFDWVKTYKILTYNQCCDLLLKKNYIFLNIFFLKFVFSGSRNKKQPLKQCRVHGFINKQTRLYCIIIIFSG